MTEPKVRMNVRRLNGRVSVIDIAGEVTAFAEGALMDAYQEATEDGAKAIVLNFSDLKYMNSSGIGLLVTMLIRAQRQGKSLLAYGLSEHYRQIFELTRLNEAILCFSGEAEAVASTSA